MKKFLIILTMFVLMGGNAIAESLTKQQQSIALAASYAALGNQTGLKQALNNGLIFGKEFIYENNLEDLTSLYINEPEEEYVVSEKMEFGCDVSKDKSLSLNVKILRMDRRGATIVNEGDLKAGDKIDVSLRFDDVDVNVKCQVSIVEGNLAQIKFKDLPKDVANKITFRYMRMANR